MDFITIIPARFSSSRLPGKPLLDIHGLPMVVRVLKKAKMSGSRRTIVATDHTRIERVIKDLGEEVYLTKMKHHSGIERIGEVINYYRFSDQQIIVNLQCDEPLIPEKIIYEMVQSFRNKRADVVTLSTYSSNKKELFDPNVVKLVTDSMNYASYFSRSPIPWDRENFSNLTGIDNVEPFLRHIGIYIYRSRLIKEYISWSPSPLENIEMLEQLRFLWKRKKIYVEKSNIIPYLSIDTPKDLRKIQSMKISLL